tara:strand:+ start:3771 stop:4205 length:435 start_codon:yes stop_codon:yes gene_type:complete
VQVVGSETYDRRLILPVGVTLIGEYGTGSIKSLSFSFYDSVTERRSVLHNVPYTPSDPYSHNAIETMIGEAHETWITQVRAQGKKKPKMTLDQRKEAGKILDEIRVNKEKRNESTTGKIYFEGTKIDRKKLNRKFKRKARANRR